MQQRRNHDEGEEKSFVSGEERAANVISSRQYFEHQNWGSAGMCTNVIHFRTPTVFVFFETAKQSRSHDEGEEKSSVLEKQRGLETFHSAKPYIEESSSSTVLILRGRQVQECSRPPLLKIQKLAKMREQYLLVLRRWGRCEHEIMHDVFDK